MDESTLYWIMKLDDIRQCMLIITLIFSLAGVIVSAAYFGTKAESTPLRPMKNTWKFMVFIFMFFATALPMGIGATFLPSTRQAVIIKTLPAIVNNEELQVEGKEVYKLMKGWLKKQVEDKTVQE